MLIKNFLKIPREKLEGKIKRSVFVSKRDDKQKHLGCKKVVWRGQEKQ